MRFPWLAGVSVLLLTGMAFSQQSTSQPADSQTAEDAPANPSSAGSDSWLSRPHLTGDWGGVRSALAEKGVTFNLDVTQILQQNAHGGADTNRGLRYSGSGDLTFLIDTAKLGLWPSGTIILNGEPKWGNGVNAAVGSLVPANYDAFKPIADRSGVIALSEWFIWQDFLDKKLSFFVGKLDPARVFDKNVFANDERTQFMNAALRNNVQLGAFAPYTTLGAGFQLAPTDWLTIDTAIVDADGSATRTGFDTAFHGPAENVSIAHEWTLKIKPFDLPGNQRFGIVWSGKDFKDLNPVQPFQALTPALIRVLGLNTVNHIAPLLPYEHSGHNLMAYCNFDQYLYQKKDDPTQGFGLFGRLGWAQQDVNAVTGFYDVGLGGKGLIPDRKHDTYGVGYYYLNLTNRLPSIFQSEQGIEAYYNIEITPWLHISPDLQVIVDPGGTGLHDTSIVYGIRAQLSL